ncbi:MULTISPECIES: hypothetical protein [unclassified Streptomyces]|uniref:hypothetical protein n=1 Tax=unclassified Streptomyces TaxID=2593676 RepID=UPI002DD8DEF2|nr:hypothetical protein [Streptomyces sp. NBC_01445]WSE06989.1 hypothetical protein OG574_28840 [Streptomyces sp. NBC_01445]
MAPTRAHARTCSHIPTRRRGLRVAALLALAGAMTACSTQVDPAQRTYRQAMDAMYPDVYDAAKAVDPGREPEEFGGGSSACHPQDFVEDSMDDAQVVASADVSVTLGAADSRSPDQLVREVVTRLEGKGWKRSGNKEKRDDEVAARVTRPGFGSVHVSAHREHPENKRDFTVFDVGVVTDCLRNPSFSSR